MTRRSLFSRVLGLAAILIAATAGASPTLAELHVIDQGVDSRRAHEEFLKIDEYRMYAAASQERGGSRDTLRLFFAAQKDRPRGQSPPGRPYVATRSSHRRWFVAMRHALAILPKGRVQASCVADVEPRSKQE